MVVDDDDDDDDDLKQFSLERRVLKFGILIDFDLNNGTIWLWVAGFVSFCFVSLV